MCPTDEEFKEYIERCFNPPTSVQVDPDTRDFATNVTIPLLDEAITPLEVQQQVKLLKSDKACGPDGLSPGIIKILPEQWILLITSIFNVIFLSRDYPLAWLRARLCTIFKRGDRKNVANYRGINIINSLAKLYDMVLCSRLKLWFKPFREQAGAQEKRGCLEHIVALRLLCDMAKRKKWKLFVTFVDFAQAYDRVPRHKLFLVLRSLGCGSVMLCALIAMYTMTESWVGTSLVMISMGVRQGSPTSCLLFIIFVNDMIRIIKQESGHDGFLQWLHVLVLMDDTVLLSTTKTGMLSKLSLLQKYCSDYGMSVNQSKTKFFVINGGRADAEPLVVGSLVVEHCDKYVYLGSPFTSDGSVSSAVKTQATLKMPHVLKFVSFIKKNNDIPFVVKKRVFDAALMSTLIYGCESWLAADLKPMAKMYNWCVKQLLGVRRSTCNDVCLVELGYPPLKDLIKFKQHKFFRTIWQERNSYDDDPLYFTMKIVCETNTVTARLIREFLASEVASLDVSLQNVISEISGSGSSRRKTYKEINPSFSVHSIYNTKHTIDENHRMSFTKLRVSGHCLACETGRWNRRGRGRLPLEERLCVCAEVQTERHVVQDCPLTQHLRDKYNFTTLEQLFSNNFSADVVCKIVHEILSTF